MSHSSQGDLIKTFHAPHDRFARKLVACLRSPLKVAGIRGRYAGACKYKWCVLRPLCFVQGESLAQLKRGGKERFKATRKRIGKDLLHELADAWGYMIFQEVGVINRERLVETDRLRRFKISEWPMWRCAGSTQLPIESQESCSVLAQVGQACLRIDALSSCQFLELFLNECIPLVLCAARRGGLTWRAFSSRNRRLGGMA